MSKILIGNIKGPQGEQGVQGPQGPQGIPGPAGPTGIVDSNSTVEFEEAKTRQPLESGNSIGILFGKIKKYFSDLKNTAFLPTVNNLETARAGEGVLDAYQGNVLKTKIDNINRNLNFYPDRENRIEISDSPYIAPSNGWVILIVRGVDSYNIGWIYGTIDEIPYAIDGGIPVKNTLWLPIKEGKTLTFERSSKDCLVIFYHNSL